jgi:hypothetical protein
MTINEYELSISKIERNHNHYYYYQHYGTSQLVVVINGLSPKSYDP